MKDSVVQAGDPVLRATAAPVAKKDLTSARLAKLIAHMKKILHQEQFGVALAAPQAGEPLRLFVVAGSVFAHEEKPLAKDASPKDRVFINPHITRRSKKVKEMSEGCLSVRGTYGTVLRHEKVTLVAQDEHGKTVTHNAAGLLAHIFQHEVDHLDGILYTDKAVHLEADEDMQSAREKLKEKRGV